jgi:hypothetical protein
VVNVKARVGELRLKYRPFATLDQLNVSLLARKKHGHFHYHRSSSPEHTIFLGQDGGVIAYHVPSAALQNQPDLTLSFENLQQLKKRNHQGVDRGVAIQRHYLVWCPMSPVPFASAEFRDDGEAAKNFTDASASLLQEASHIMAQVFPKIYDDYTRYPLPPGLKRMAGAWCGYAVNVGSENAPVETEVHRDVGESPFGMSCLSAYGNYRGGEVVLWEAELIIDLRPGDLLFFPDAVVHHSNNPVLKGIRHSVVAFTPRNVLSWWTRACGRDDSRERELKARREEFMKMIKKLEKEAKLISLLNPKRKRKDGGKQRQTGRVGFNSKGRK